MPTKQIRLRTLVTEETHQIRLDISRRTIRRTLGASSITSLRHDYGTQQVDSAEYSKGRHTSAYSCRDELFATSFLVRLPS
jgi:hypothetical protein